MKKKFTLVVFVVVLISILAVIAYFFVPNNRVVVAYPGKTTTLVIEGSVIDCESPPFFENNQILLPINIIKEHFDETVFWDDSANKVIITTQDKVVKMNTDSLTAYVNNNPVELSVTARKISETVYLPIDFLEDIYRIDASFIKETNVVVIDYRSRIKKIAEVISEEAPVRDGMSIRYPILNKLKKGAQIWAFDEYEKWYKVRTDDGVVGYIEKRFIKITSLTSSTYTEETSSPVQDILKGKLNLTWEQIENRTPDMSRVGKIAGLDVVSPTWFHLTGEDGTVISRADLGYVQWAKRNGYKVWALFSNSFDPKLTSKILNSSVLREEVIKRILVYAELYKLDGINIDFENMYLKDKDMFSQFIREMAPLLRAQELTVSVDVGVPGGSDQWSKCYDRKALAKAVDYIMVMTYDQHWGTSPESGSVAQYVWVEKKLKETLRDVPSSKLFLGLPFYIREWKEVTGPDGKVKVSQNAVLSMGKAKERIRANNAEVNWDSESGQFYAEYKKDGAVYKMWLEDEKSINLKSSLVHKYGLAGAASWRRGFETEGVWSVLNTNLKNNINYLEWAQANSNHEYKYE